MNLYGLKRPSRALHAFTRVTVEQWDKFRAMRRTLATSLGSQAVIAARRAAKVAHPDPLSDAEKAKRRDRNRAKAARRRNRR